MFAKSRIAAAALAALTLTTALAATASEAEARPRHGTAIGIGIAAGALIGLAAASHAYAAPVYYAGPRYRECGYIKRYDRMGRAHYEKVCYAY